MEYVDQRWVQHSPAVMRLRDAKPDRPDGLYLHGLSEGMIRCANLFGETVDLFDWYRRKGHILPITFNGSDGEQFAYNEDGDNNKPVGKNPGEGWPGKDWYIQEFTARGIPEELLLPTGPALHTRHEVTQLLNLAKERDWKRVGIITVPWHYPRVFTNLVKVMQDGSYYLAAYALVPLKINWDTPMKGSQGLEDTHPFRESLNYFPKTLVDQDRGLACSFEDLFRYMDNREKIATTNSWL